MGIKEKGKTFGNFLYRLFFTREDGLDMLQLMFLLIIIYFMVAFTFAGMGMWTVTNMAWSAFISIFATLAIAGTPKWVAELLAQRQDRQGGYGGYGGGYGGRYGGGYGGYDGGEYDDPHTEDEPNNEGEAEIG